MAQTVATYIANGTQTAFRAVGWIPSATVTATVNGTPVTVLSVFEGLVVLASAPPAGATVRILSAADTRPVANGQLVPVPEVPTDAGRVLTARADGGTEWANASVEWQNLTGVPTEFPPAPHGHNASDITGLATVATSGNYEDLSNRLIVPSNMVRFATARLGIVSTTPLVNENWNNLPFVTTPPGCYDDIGLIFIGRLFRFPSWVRYAKLDVHIFTDILTAEYCHLAAGRLFWNFQTHGSTPPNNSNIGIGYDSKSISGCRRGQFRNFIDQETGGRIYAVLPSSDSEVDEDGNLHAHGAAAYIGGGNRNLRNNAEVRLTVMAWGVNT